MDTQRKDLGSANARILRHRHELRNEEPTSVAESLRNLLSRSPYSDLGLLPGATAQDRNLRLWREAQVPKRHLENQAKAEERHGSWRTAHDKIVSQIGSGFLFALAGERGTGKTQIGVSAIARASGVGRRCRYVAAMDVFLCIRATFKSDLVTERDVLTMFTCPDLLVIDEWQERGETEWEDRLLTYIVDQRYGAMRDTILISNLKPADFAESAGPSIVSRLAECGGMIVCDWPSFRTPRAGA